MSADAYVGSGTTIDFATSGFSMEVTSINWSGIGGREKLDATPLSQETGFGCFILTKISDPGEMAIEGNFNPDITPLTALSDEGEVITITFPIRDPGNTNNATWVATAAMTDFETGDMTHDDKVTFSATISVLENIVITPESA